ncbi:MAG: M20/M25/M40 family metallo-hydrolase [Ardenticatenaceae bacterium]|nr:M20/M25/M40 family metallo-hydrolase [Ardenticatenaceae bacterium]HBY98472.1 aminopeptidase [Chloroflexota bacterium]
MPEKNDREERMFTLVKELTELPGPIGREEKVLAYLEEHWGSRVVRIERDGIGNLIARVGGRGPKLLVDAHADEICLMVQSITPDGFLRLSQWNRHPQSVPGWLYPIGQPALVIGRNSSVQGFFAAQTGHIANAHPAGSAERPWNDIFIDIGATSADEARSWGIQIGNRAIWTPQTRRVGHYITGKAMDNRVAIAIMALLLEEIDPEALNFELAYSVTVQEENGCTGALSLCLREGFHQAIAIDVGLSGDLPLEGLNFMPVRLGGGPTLVHKDWVHYDPHLTDQLLDHAERAGIPVQHAIFHNYGSDGGAFIRQGIRTALLAFPCRYTHSPFETVALSDLLLSVDLLKEFLTRRL